MNELVVPLANTVIKFSIAPYEPSAAIAKAPSNLQHIKDVHIPSLRKEATHPPSHVRTLPGEPPSCKVKAF
jgi:hypothetical protein